MSYATASADELRPARQRPRKTHSATSERGRRAEAAAGKERAEAVTGRRPADSGRGDGRGGDQDEGRFQGPGRERRQESTAMEIWDQVGEETGVCPQKVGERGEGPLEGIRP